MRIKTETWNKLVRDRIPDILQEYGGQVEVKVINDPKKRLKLLKQKLKEETDEVVRCGKDGLLEECGDVLTALEDLVEEAGFSIYELREMQQEKDRLKGRFKKGIFLISTKGKPYGRNN